MYNRKIAPIVSKIKREIEDTIKISKSTLEKPNHNYQSNPPHDYQRAKLSTFYLFLKGSLGHQNHQLVTTCNKWHD
jgi:hypothetical protein